MDTENKEKNAETSKNAATIVSGIATIAFVPEGTNKVTGEIVKPHFTLTFENSFAGVKQDKSTGIYGETEINELTLDAGYFKAMLYEGSFELGVITADKKEKGFPMGNFMIAALVPKVHVVMSRTKFEQGSEYTDASGLVKVHTYAGYNTQLKSVSPTKDVAAKLERIMLATF